MGFTSESDTTALIVGKLIEKDIALCKLTNNTKDPKFWNQVAEDKY